MVVVLECLLHQTPNDKSRRSKSEWSDEVESVQWLIFGVFSQISPAELAHQESLIQERESEIREIETGIHELNEIFRDLGTLVTEQGAMLSMLFRAPERPST